MPRLLKTDPGMTHADRLDFTDDPVGVTPALKAARSARFEFGETPR